MEKKIAEQIMKHKELYYLGVPEISDREYDLLEEQLRKINPNNPVLSFVGHQKISNKIKHDQKMLSLDKTYKKEELIKWSDGKEIISMEKIDGSSCSLIYEQGMIKIAKTRGDGTYGENISSKVLLIESIPKKIKTLTRVEIRGEIYCSKKNFSILKRELEENGEEIPSSQRNIVAGILGRKDKIRYAKYLSFYAFDILSENRSYKKEIEKIKLLIKYNFEVPPYKTITEKKDLELDLEISEKRLQETKEYLIDGIVYTYNDLELHDKLGYTAHHPRYRIAYKIAGESKAAMIEEIKWNISRFGVLTPVAVIEPTELSQAIISNVSLHNFALVKKNKIKKRDIIEVIRSGEVIPKYLKTITSSDEPIEIPRNCPNCHTQLTNDEVRLTCPNTECSERVLQEIVYFVQTIGIEDLSEKRINELIRHGLVEKIPDLFKITKDELMELDKVKEKLATKLIKNIQQVKKIDLDLFIASLGVIGGGKNTVAKIITAGHKTLEQLQSLSIEQLMEIDGFAEKSATDFCQSLKAKKRLIEDLMKQGIKINQIEQATGNRFPFSVCITGKLSRPRKVIADEVIKNGGKVMSSVTSKTDYLITNEVSASSKYKKAIELNKRIISEEELFKILTDEK
jgi:DNA ligase (NAD+)